MSTIAIVTTLDDLIGELESIRDTHAEGGAMRVKAFVPHTGGAMDYPTLSVLSGPGDDDMLLIGGLEK